MSTFPWGLLLLVGAVVIVSWVFRKRRQPAAPVVYESPPMEAGWGRQPPGPAQQPGAGGMGGNMMGGLATGLAVGAGALAAQEIGRRVMGEHGQQGIGSVDENRHLGGTARDSSLARDAGAGSVGIDNTGSWDDAGGSYGGDDGGGSDS